MSRTRTPPFREPLLPRPYPDDKFEGFAWRSVPVQMVWVRDLTPTQECIRLDRLAALNSGHAPEGGDTALHVYSLEGRLLIHDGHTRFVLAMIRGEDRVPARVAH